MAKFEIDGNTFHVGDDGLDIHFDIDVQSGLVEISASDNNGYDNKMYMKRETAMFLALWLKSRLSE